VKRPALSALAAFVAMAIPATPAAAQEIVDGGRIDAIIAVARNYGSATIDTQHDGNPKIAGRMSGVPYSVFFLNCATQTTCNDMNFYAGFLGAKLPPEKINRWNQDKRFGKAYLDQDGDAVIEMDVNIQDGVTRANMSQTFAIWRLLMDQFTRFIGFGKS